MRIYTSGNSALDFCARCKPPDNQLTREYFSEDGEGPDGRGDCYGYDADHPDYEDEDYHCHQCGRGLKACDN